MKSERGTERDSGKAVTWKSFSQVLSFLGFLISVNKSHLHNRGKFVPNHFEDFEGRVSFPCIRRQLRLHVPPSRKTQNCQGLPLFSACGEMAEWSKATVC